MACTNTQPAVSTRAWVVNHFHQQWQRNLNPCCQHHSTPVHTRAPTPVHTFSHAQALNLPRLLAQLGFPVKGHASMPRAMAADATKKMLRQAKVKFHPDKVWAWVWDWRAEELE